MSAGFVPYASGVVAAETTAPTVPTAVAVSNPAANQTASVTFTAATDLVSVSGYFAYLDGQGVPWPGGQSVSSPIALTGVPAGNHSVIVKAYNPAGILSAASAPVNFTIPAPAAASGSGSGTGANTNASLTGVVANTTLALPAGVMIESISVRETAGVAMGANLNIGTSAGLADVVSVPVGANGVAPIFGASLNNAVFAAAQTLYFSATTWGGTLNITVNYAGIN